MWSFQIPFGLHENQTRLSARVGAASAAIYNHCFLFSLLLRPPPPLFVLAIVCEGKHNVIVDGISLGIELRYRLIRHGMLQEYSR